MPAPYTITLTIPTDVMAARICNAICPQAGVNLVAAKQAIHDWISAAIIANETGQAQAAALAAVVAPVTPVIT